jgi:uncharacterized protein YbjT (DUF2867 family)
MRATYMPLVTVFGGTGFLGRRIVAALLDRGALVRVAARHPERGPAESDRVAHVTADVTDPATVEAAMASADAVANAVSLYVERGDASFRAVHLDAARRVAETAARRGARLLHVSGIGSDPDAASPYVRFRGLGEDAVRAACPGATVFRPAVMIGPNDAFLSALAGLVRSPVVPLFGDGGTRLAPVFVGDVAAAAAVALTDPEPRPGVSELGGPEALSYRDLVRRVAEHLGRRPLLVPLPLSAWGALAAAGRVLPSPPITEGQVALMRRDNVPAPGSPGLEAFGVGPTDLATVLRDALPQG